MSLSQFVKSCAAVASALIFSFSPALAQADEIKPTSPANLSTTGAAQGVVQTDIHRPRIGLALGGGGTRGIAHIAVLRELEKNGIHVDCVAGTSMGAIVGGLYCAGLTPDQIEQLFRDKKFVRSYDTVPIPVRVSLIPLFFVPHLFGYHPYDGLYRGKRFANYMSDSVPTGNRNIENLPIPFCAVASNLVNGQPYAIKNGNLGTAMQASSAIPGLRRPVEHEGTLLVDGGVVANLPVDYCRAMGADIVIAVNVDEELGTIQKRHFHKIGTVPYRCLNMHLASIDAAQIANADVVIHPDVAGIELLSHKIKDMDLALAAGKKATDKAIPSIQEQINKKLARSGSEDKS